MPPSVPRPVRSLTVLLLGAVLSVLLSTSLSMVVVAPAQADHVRLPEDRRLVSYVVREGDTASGLAVRFHAWCIKNRLEDGRPPS